MKRNTTLPLLTFFLLLGFFSVWLIDRLWDQSPSGEGEPITAEERTEDFAWEVTPGESGGERPEPFVEMVPYLPAVVLSDFPETTREWVAAVEEGIPLRIDLGDGHGVPWSFAPTSAITEDFMVSTGTAEQSRPPLVTYHGRPLERGVAGEQDAFLSIVGGRAAMMMFREGEILHVRQNEAGDWEMEREALEAGVWHCTVTDGISKIQGGEVMLPYREENWERIAVTPEVAASDGRDPLSGELTAVERRIPYGQQYAASLRSMLGVLVWERAGANTEGNIASKTATLLTLAASLNAIYENQIGLNYVLQEIILLVDGSDWEDERIIYDSNQSATNADLWPFTSWMSFHRPQGTWGWTVATKIGRMSGGANGRAWIEGAGSVWGTNVNRNTGFSLVGHEIGHNVGSEHTHGGIMNASSNTSRDFFRIDSWANSGETGAKMVWNYMRLAAENSPRAYGSAPLRNAAEIPFAQDDKAVTRSGVPVVIDVLANDLSQVVAGAQNTVLTVVETGAVFPPHAGTTTHSADQVVFTPSADFAGVARFSYTIRGDVGNDGQGWLHKGDVAVVVVENPAADAPVLTVERGPAANNHHNERVILNWDPQANRPEFWEIQRAVNGSAFQPLGITDGGDRQWIDLQIHRSSTVRYRIRAADEGNGPGAWGYGNTLAAADDPWGFWDDFASGNLIGWEQWTNQVDSALPDDSSTGRFDFSVQNGQAVLTATETDEPRLGLLVRPQVYDVAETGDLTLAATLGVQGWRLHHRVLAWIDDGGAVIWIGLEQTVGHQSANQRRVRLYATESLEDFFQQVGNYNSPALLFENSEQNETGYVTRHRASLSISPSGVGMTVVPEEENSSAAASTIGLMDPMLSNFTGVGRFAVGGFSNPQISGPAVFEVDHIGITSLPVPTRYLPALVDDFVEVLPGEAVAVAPFRNDLWIVENTALQSSPAGWSVFTQDHARNIVSIHVPKDEVPGVYEVQVRARSNNYNANNDGLTAVSSIWVTVLDQPSEANTLELVHYRGDPPLHFFPLANDWASGFLNLDQVDPRTATNTTFDLGGNSYRLVSATLNTGGVGSIALRTMPAVVNGVRVDRNTGEIIYTRSNVNEGTANISYTFEDSRGETQTGTVLIHLLRSGAPRISAHPLGQRLTVGDPLELSVTASGSGLSYQWFRDGTAISGATTSTFSVGSVSAANAGEYHVEVTNSDGSLSSAAALVTVTEDPLGGPTISAIADQTTPYETTLEGLSFTVGDPVVSADDLVVTAHAADETLLPDAGIVLGGSGATRSLSLSPAPGVFGTTAVHVTVSNGTEQVETSFSFTIQPPPPPVIIVQPQPQSAALGGSATFSVTAEGIGVLSYQWFKDGAALAGQTADTLTLSNIGYIDSGLYWAVISNDGGDTLSEPAGLTVEGAPFILAQPQSQAVPAGAEASLSVNVAGSTPLTYQWHGPVGPIADSNSATLIIASMAEADEGSYFVVVSNILDTVTSDTVILAILPPPEVPANVTASAVSSREIALSWTDPTGPSDRTDGFEVEGAATASGPWTMLSDQSETTFLHEDLEPETTYFYRVRAFNEAGFSDWSAVAFATTLESLQSRYLISFGDTAYSTDGINTWQNFQLRQTAGANSAFLAHTDVVLENSEGEEGSISFSASSDITGDVVGQNEPAITDFGGNPFDWFNPAEEAQRITPAFNQQNSNITYTFSGFDPADAVTFELVIRRTDTGRNITLVASGDGGEPVTLLANADSGVTRFVTLEASGSESYEFELTSNAGTWVGTINAMSILVEGSGVERETPVITAWPTASDITFGQTLGEAELTGGAAENALGETVVGSFVFENPDLVPAEGTTDQVVRFDPTLESLYNSVLGLVSVTVLPPPPTFAVSYHANGGDNAPEDGNAYLEGDTVTVLGPGSLLRSGHAFTGWNTAANGSGTGYQPGNTFPMPAAEVTLYAQWIEVEMYLLSFNVNGGSGDAPVTLSLEPGDTVTLPGPGELSKSGHVFNGWRDNLGAFTYAVGDTLTMPAYDLVLAAQWTVLGGEGEYVQPFHNTLNQLEVEDAGIGWQRAVHDGDISTDQVGRLSAENGPDGEPGFAYTFRNNNNASLMWYEGLTLSQATLEEFSAYVGHGNGNNIIRYLIRIGDNWYATADGGGKAPTVGNAAWFENGAVKYTVSFSSENTWVQVVGFNGTSAGTFTLLGGGSLTPLASLPDGDITAVGVYLANLGGSSTRFDDFTVKWTGPGEGHTVTYAANGGTGSVPVDGNQYADGTLITVMGQGALTRDGYSFGGWRDEVAEVTYTPLDTFAMPGRDVTLVAQWTSEGDGPPPHGPVLFVNHAAGGVDNGSSWADAFTSLRGALAAAQAGQEIWVAAGSYSPYLSDRAADTFLIPSGVALYGGFAGTETERGQRDWEANETILSGHIGGQTNLRHIVTATGAVDARVDGFTIRDGHADGSNPYLDAVGAAVFVGLGEARLTLANCRIVETVGTEGGAVYFSPDAGDPVLRIENTVFENNEATADWARGILQIRSSAAGVWIQDSRFEGNHSGIFSEAGRLQVLRTQFLNQEKLAVDINYHDAHNDFVNCVFDQNGGGAVRMVNSAELRVANSVFARNTIPEDEGFGAALNISQGRFEVYNSTFYDNSADEGAAISWNYGWAGDATSLIHNSIFWGNTGDNVILLERYASDAMTLKLRNTLLQGGAGSIMAWDDPVVVIENLLDSDPLFADAGDPAGPDGRWGTADDGLRLQSASPATAAGLAGLLPADWLDLNGNEDLAEPLPLDLLNVARVQGDHPSLGAYEPNQSTDPLDAYEDWVAANNIIGGMADETNGVANLLRYALGGNADTPMVDLMPTMQTGPALEGINLSLNFYRIDDPLVHYAVWYSSDLVNWGTEPVWQGYGAHEGSAGLYEVSHASAGSRGFLRLVVTRGEGG